MRKSGKRQIELLAPAKNVECGIAAIDHGADAVYVGAMRFGARASAGNSVEDIAQLCRYAHQFGAKVYVTVNTIVYEQELQATRLLLADLHRVGADAVLVQDMGVLQMALDEGLVVHASTQTDNRTAAKVAWLYGLGVTRVVLARELSLQDMADIHAHVPGVELEAFVHGALCVSYSGLCYASQYCFRRSANRGECAQFCRMKFSLKDADGKEIVHQRHLLSLKDLCRIDDLDGLLDAGVTSFKIEGRLKDAAYVKNVVAAYRQRLDAVIRRHPDRYVPASVGKVSYAFKPDLLKSFNRGYTSYFLHGGRGADGRLLNRTVDVASFDTPKALGEPVGKVKELRRDSLVVAGTASFANGDGLCYFTPERELAGFRVNRASGNRLFPQRMPSDLRPGTVLYRNQDAAFDRLLNAKQPPSARRSIAVVMHYGLTPDGVFAEMTANGLSARAEIATVRQSAQKSPRENIERQLSKLGNTIYDCTRVDIDEDALAYFVPNSLLSDLRRTVIRRFADICVPHPSAASPLPGRTLVPVAPLSADKAAAVWPREYQRFPYLYNVCNSLARQFYQYVGLSQQVTAMENGETVAPHSGHMLLMQCRHCLRFSLGFCHRRGGQEPFWKEPLSLELSDGRQFPLEFDCRQCQMNVYAK